MHVLTNLEYREVVMSLLFIFCQFHRMNSSDSDDKLRTPQNYPNNTLKFQISARMRTSYLDPLVPIELEVTAIDMVEL